MGLYVQDTNKNREALALNGIKFEQTIYVLQESGMKSVYEGENYYGDEEFTP